MISMNKAINYKTVLKIVMVTATLTAGCFKILYGWDQDESYIMLLVFRLLKGDIIFKDIWDLHQTCAVLPAVLVSGYYKAFGITGMAVFLRCVTQILLVLTAVFLYLVINRSYGPDAAFFSAFIVLNMLPRATLQMEYGLSTVIFSIIASALLLDVWKNNVSRATLKIVFAGLFYGLSVYVYPTMIITVPLYFYITCFRLGDSMRQRVRYAILFWVTCGILAGLFFAYVFSHITPRDFLTVLGEFGKTADHTVMFPAFQNPAVILKSGIRIVIFLSVTLGLWFLLRKKLIHPSQVFFVFLVVSFISVVIPNITGLRQSGPFGLLERYIVMAVISVFISFYTDDKPLFWTFLMGGLFYYLGSLMGSALGFNENAMFLEMTIIAGTVYGIRVMDLYEDEKIRIFSFTAICFLIFELAFSKGYFVRVNNTDPANITECNSILNKGPCYGIRVRGTQKSGYDSHIEIIERNSTEDQVYMYLGNDPIYNFFFRGEVTSAQYVGTARPNIQFVDYYSVFGHELPNQIYIDKSMYPDIEGFMNTEFGVFLKEMGYIGSIADVDMYFILSIRK